MRGSDLPWFLPGDPNSLPTPLCTHCSFPFPYLWKPSKHLKTELLLATSAMGAMACSCSRASGDTCVQGTPPTALTLCSHSFEVASCISSWESFSCSRSQSCLQNKEMPWLLEKNFHSQRTDNSSTDLYSHILESQPDMPLVPPTSPSDIDRWGSEVTCSGAHRSPTQSYLWSPVLVASPSPVISLLSHLRS